MTYEDPNTGRDRNLGQEEVGSSLGSWLAGIVFLAAVLFGGWYFFNHSQKVADVNQPTPSTAANTSSGPGVQGSEGGTNGPAASSSAGASSGTSGSTTQPANNGVDANTTQPAQDSTGVKGAEGGKNGPAANTPPSSDTPANNPAPAPSTNQ